MNNQAKHGLAAAMTCLSITKLFSLSILFLVASTLNPALADKIIDNPFAVLPSATDPAITAFNEPNICWLPESHPRNALLLFLPGTSGTPSQLKFLSTASQLGYHVVALEYPDELAAQAACMRSSDPDAYIKFRLEIIQGKDSSPAIEISRTDSIENRLTKLLLYLAKKQPDKGWSEFLDNDGEPAWSKIAVCGQSQGGGHAYFVSKLHKVARVIFFGSPKDYSVYFHAPAKGFDNETKTPLDRYFAFNHKEDTKANVNYKQQLEIFDQMKLTSLGIADADNPTPNYNHAHIIYTDAHPSQKQLKAHVFPMNNSSVKSSNGEPICPPVWEYMLTEPVK